MLHLVLVSDHSTSRNVLYSKGAGKGSPSLSHTFRTAAWSAIQPYHKPLLIRYMPILIEPEKDVAVVLGGNLDMSDKSRQQSPIFVSKTAFVEQFNFEGSSALPPGIP